MINRELDHENPDYKSLVKAIALGAKNEPYKDEQGRLDIGAIAQEILNSGFLDSAREEAVEQYKKDTELHVKYQELRAFNRGAEAAINFIDSKREIN